MRKIKMDKETVEFYKRLTLSRLATDAYEKFKIKWFPMHGYSLEDIFQAAVENGTVEQFEENGINGECYPCFDEFVQNDFINRDVAKTLLSEGDMKLYDNCFKED